MATKHGGKGRKIGRNKRPVRYPLMKDNAPPAGKKARKDAIMNHYERYIKDRSG